MNHLSEYRVGDFVLDSGDLTPFEHFGAIRGIRELEETLISGAVRPPEGVRGDIIDFRGEDGQMRIYWTRIWYEEMKR